MPHEQIDPKLVRRMESVLHPPKEIATLRTLHHDNERTKWFGVIRDSTDHMVFEDYGRYPMLMLDLPPLEENAERYPKLTSFIGVTNAGKSSIIRMLIERSSQRPVDGSPQDFPTPVVGSATHDSQATSGDVHLYADPASWTSEVPILFADCEGFEGGEKPPFGSRTNAHTQSNAGRASEGWVNARPIQWAVTEDDRRREKAVTVLYPRLLYTFSDCVVFVLRNPKTFSSAVLTKLLAWGAAAMEKSLNQPALPHCIVVLNGSDPRIDSRQWDIQGATDALLSSAGASLDSSEIAPQFLKLAEYWRCLGRSIATLKDLILCYYATFKAIRIPIAPHYNLMEQQLELLHSAIQIDCQASHKAKRRARLLVNHEELGLYFQSGFEHFATHLDQPFNFVQVALSHNPIPRDFGEHILQLCATLSSRLPELNHTVLKSMFGMLSTMLGSCVLLDCARFRKGRLSDIFPNYVDYFRNVIAGYSELHLPCSYVSVDGSRKCLLVKARHYAGRHQDADGIIAVGDYDSAMDHSFSQEWVEQLQSDIVRLHRIFTDLIENEAQTRERASKSEERLAFEIHVDHLDQFYRSIVPASWVRSHSSCFCCLMDVPQHVLRCGHALCDRCVRVYASAHAMVVRIHWCPLHPSEPHWTHPTVIRYKPRDAGVRILSLDSGGIRGVVQLETLRAIQEAADGLFAVQDFFDLIIGSGTGGLIAVALAKQDWTLDRCQDMFAAVCRHAYRTKIRGTAMISRAMRAFLAGPRYDAACLYQALKTAFGEKDAFFGLPEQFRRDIRVGVTAKSTSHRTVLIGNYRRPQHGEDDYDIERPHDPARELRTWQVVYSTMADPFLFESLRSDKPLMGVDADLTNPAPLALAEAGNIWSGDAHLDMLLSLGTGQNFKTTQEDLQQGMINDGKDASIRGRLTLVKNFTKRWLRSDKDIVCAERAWQNMVTPQSRNGLYLGKTRYARLNVDLGEETPPAQDQESQMQRLSTLVHDKLRAPQRICVLRNMAYRLIATLFFFRSSRGGSLTGAANVSGAITLRSDDSSQIRQIGRFLQQQCGPELDPYFSIRLHHERSQTRSTLVLDERIINGMIRTGLLQLPEVVIKLDCVTVSSSINLHLPARDSSDPEGYPISGFPDAFVRKPSPPGPEGCGPARPPSNDHDPPARRSTASSDKKKNSRHNLLTRPRSMLLPLARSELGAESTKSYVNIGGDTPMHEELPPPYRV